MQKTEIAPGVFRYSFPPLRIPRVDHHVYALVRGGRAAAIDASYKEYAGELLRDLRESGIELTDLIVSHFHTDHCEGIAEIGDCRIWGAGGYAQTVDRDLPAAVKARIKPDRIVEYGKEYEINDFSLVFYQGRGHAACGLLTEIDRRFLHVNDLVLFNQAGQPIVPLVFDDAEEFARSLAAIKSLGREILLAHGSCRSAEDMAADIDTRLRYLALLQELRDGFTVDKVEALCGVRYDYLDAHAGNVRAVAAIN